MRHILLLITATFALSACAQTQSAAQVHHHASHHQTHSKIMQSVESKYNFSETVSRLTNAVKGKGMTVFATIDHQAAAKQAGLTMQPATVIVFGTPKAGTPLMIKDPTLALQLPLRVLVTEVDGKVQVVFNDTRAIIAGTKIEYSDVENNLANAEKLIAATVTQ
ncbi:DUF302 domain-containing protein [Alysiella filiformis]|uniref:Uncharacterized conserved protein, DUF302 family n=1 Tax=Alysiella filiformis DSM 16848 TaxID=1120981 RepID=A0A286ED82_9NEIS|nr:DUF302 domain-containing protein [Alysiella filiformis]QMT31163.1 DUF302 domain-containing protein [Alysiella filiformis]UBQ55843.1 DUF302 domain-containing protein [Alysiella filiformis DSM 16848]SOD68850.1 Uncharacterized conserved protein, DUF302 family [Alysiella filiformis DSM 16848]